MSFFNAMADCSCDCEPVDECTGFLDVFDRSAGDIGNNWVTHFGSASIPTGGGQADLIPETLVTNAADIGDAGRSWKVFLKGTPSGIIHLIASFVDANNYNFVELDGTNLTFGSYLSGARKVHKVESVTVGIDPVLSICKTRKVSPHATYLDIEFAIDSQEFRASSMCTFGTAYDAWSRESSDATIGIYTQSGVSISQVKSLKGTIVNPPLDEVTEECDDCVWQFCLCQDNQTPPQSMYIEITGMVDDDGDPFSVCSSLNGTYEVDTLPSNIVGAPCSAAIITPNRSQSNWRVIFGTHCYDNFQPYLEADIYTSDGRNFHFKKTISSKIDCTISGNHTLPYVQPSPQPCPNSTPAARVFW